MSVVQEEPVKPVVAHCPVVTSQSCPEGQSLSAWQGAIQAPALQE